MDKLISGKTHVLGQSIAYDLPITLDPAVYVGAQVYGADGKMYYSDGTQWLEAGKTGYTGSQGYTGSKGEDGYTGSQGYQGSQGPAGGFGGATFLYTFASTTTNAAPSLGHLNFDNLDLTLAGYLYIDDEDKDGTNITAFLLTVADSTSQIKGHFRLSRSATPEDFVLFTIANLIDNGGWFTIDCDYLSGSLSSFIDSEDLLITFARTGDKGDTGYTGSRGDTGYTGSMGDLGYTGSIGYTGSKGDTGFVGSQGDTGFVGSQGELGYTGSQGIGFAGSGGTPGYAGSQGDLGYTGSIGDIGYTGSVGFTGSKGDPGEAGYSGSGGTPGFTGSQGEGFTGSAGYTGSKGDPGEAAAIGYTGSQGDIGYTGSAGYIGLDGYTGSVGFTGSQGAGFTGSVGFTGSKGEPGEAAAVGYTGSAGAGYTGSQGDTGYTGSKGAPPLQIVNFWQEGSLNPRVGTLRWYAAFPLDIVKIVARLGIAADNNVIVQLNKNGTAERLITIPAYNSGPVVDTTVINMNTDDYITVNLNQAGNGITGNDLYLQFMYQGTAYI